MKLLLLIVDCFAAILLIVTVLMHSAKGEGLGGIGGQAHLFKSSRGMESGLNKITTACAIIFLVTSTLLGFFF